MEQSHNDQLGIPVETDWAAKDLHEQKVFIEFASPGPGGWTMPTVGEFIYYEQEGRKYIFLANFVPPRPGFAMTQEMVDQIQRRTGDPGASFQCLKP